jgi:hypothetical protein
MHTALAALSLLVAAQTAVPTAGVTSWGTHYLIDQPHVIRAETHLRDCVRGATDSEQTPDAIRSGVQSCYWALAETELKADADTYYFWSGQQEAGQSPFAEFDLCVSGLASYMWDFPPNATGDSFRTSVRDCLAQFPDLRHGA